DPLDHRERRGLPGERVLERADRRGVALHLDEHPGRIVADQPAERQPGGERVRERAEPDALHHALDAEPGADGRHGRRVRSQAYQAARPWPRVAETGRTSRPGFTCVASAVQRPASKSTWGSRSTLVSSIRSAARNICGYLSGLSAPSVTDMITTFARSPRSNSAGQTRLPTFSIITTEPSGGPSSRIPRATMSASRWQPLPVLICTAAQPVARIRSASRPLAWSPSTTDTASSPPTSRMVRSSSVVLPAPGELIRLSATIPCSAKKRRFDAASWSFLASTSSSSVITRVWPCPCSWGAVVPEQPQVAHMSVSDLQLPDLQLLPAGDLEVRAPARAERDLVRQLDVGGAVAAAGPTGGVDDHQLRSFARRAGGAQLEAEPHGVGQDAGQAADLQGERAHG